MKDLANPNNLMSQIIPSLFHPEFHPDFLKMKLGDVSPLMNNPSGKFKNDVDKLKDNVFDALARFLADPCSGTDWCPPEKGAKLRDILNNLK